MESDLHYPLPTTHRETVSRPGAAFRKVPLTTHRLLLTTHRLLLTTYYLLLTTHYSPLTTHHLLLTTHHSLLTTYYSPLTIYYSLLTRCGFFGKYHASSLPADAPYAKLQQTVVRSQVVLSSKQFALAVFSVDRYSDLQVRAAGFDVAEALHEGNILPNSFHAPEWVISHAGSEASTKPLGSLYEASTKPLGSL